MPVPQLSIRHLENPTSLPLDVEYLMAGTLKLGNEAWLVLRDDVGEHELPIRDPTVEHRLLHNVPCWVGGPLIYNDDVALIGRLEIEDGRLVVANVVSAQVRRNDETYEF